MYDRDKRYEYQAKGLLKRVGRESMDAVTQEDIDKFRQNPDGLAPDTAESYIKALSILSGKKFNGKKLRRKSQRPKPVVPLEQLGAVYEVAKRRKNQWFCCFLKFGYITGFRLGDLTGLHVSEIEATRIVHTANKTQHWHCIPRHYILDCAMPKKEYPLKKSHFTCRKWIRHYCDIADVPRFTPRALRRTAITQYERAHPGSGAVLQGIALNTTLLKSYLDQYEFLKMAQESLVIPDEMLPKRRRVRQQAEEKSLVSAFRRLPADERTAVLRLISRGR